MVWSASPIPGALQKGQGGGDLPQMWCKEDEGEDVNKATILGGGQECSSSAGIVKTIY